MLNLGGDGMADSNNALGSSSDEAKNNSKLDVTLIDAFRIKELNLLIISYIFRETHDSFIRQTFELNPVGTYSLQTLNEERLQQENFCIGAVIGILSAGIIGDLWLRGKHFLQILMVNCVLLCLDIFLFSTSRVVDDSF
jgi:hypothetical protein